MVYGGLNIVMLFFPNAQSRNFFQIHESFVNEPDDYVTMNFVLIEAAKRSVTIPECILRRFC
jgi:hypothetical protein